MQRLVCTLIVGLFSCLALAGPAFGADHRPNLIVIIADDMAWNDCTAYGHPSIQTPNIGRLAKEGMTFTNAFKFSANELLGFLYESKAAYTKNRITATTTTITIDRIFNLV